MPYDWKNDPKTTEKSRSLGSYPFIESFGSKENLSRASAEFGVKTVLDLGCGRGNILFHALDLGFERADGVEYFESHIAAARRLLKKFPKSDYTVYRGDLRSWRPKRRYDLIYMFDPIFESEARAAFFGNLMGYLNDGQLIFYISVDPSRNHDLITNHFEPTGNDVDFPLYRFRSFAALKT